VEKVHEGAHEHGGDALKGRAIPVTLAIVATTMAIYKLVDDEIGKVEFKSLQEASNKWAFYQAKSTKEQLYRVAKDQLTVLAAGGTEAQMAQAQKLGAEYESAVKRYEEEKKDIEKEARGHLAAHEHAEHRGDKLKLSDGVFSISLAFLAMAAIRSSRPLFLVSAGLAAAAAALGLWGILT
jgi:hypothetical protein